LFEGGGGGGGGVAGEACLSYTETSYWSVKDISGLNSPQNRGPSYAYPRSDNADRGTEGSRKLKVPRFRDNSTGWW